MEEKGKVLAQRSLVRLEAVRVKAPGRLTGDEPALIAARQDAKAASDSGVALGFYAAGRIAEELDHIDAAVQSYRQAVAANRSWRVMAACSASRWPASCCCKRNRPRRKNCRNSVGSTPRRKTLFERLPGAAERHVASAAGR